MTLTEKRYLDPWPLLMPRRSSLSPIQSKSSVADFIDVTLMSNIHRKKKSESESSDWEDKTFLPVDEQEEYLQETYGNELPKLR